MKVVVEEGCRGTSEELVRFILPDGTVIEASAELQDCQCRDGRVVLSHEVKELPWHHLVGIKNLKGQALAPGQLRAWADDPKRELECIFCGTRLPLDTQFCPRCREYKGIGPYVPGWSEEDNAQLV